MAKIINISSISITITDLSLTLAPGAVGYKNDIDVEASDDIREFLPDNNFIKVKWDKDTMITRNEFEMDDSQEAVDISAQIAVHAAKTTGVHGVGSETVGTKDKDTYLDKGGSNEVTASNAKSAVTLKHTQGTDQGLDTGGANAVVVADVKDAVTKKHAAGTDQGLDTGGANAVTAASIKTALDTTIPAKLDSSKLVAVESGASTGSGATEVLTVAGLAAGDTILFVCNSTVGGTPANCIVNGFSYSSPGNLSVTWIDNPGAGAKVTVCLKKA